MEWARAYWSRGTSEIQHDFPSNIYPPFHLILYSIFLPFSQANGFWFSNFIASATWLWVLLRIAPRTWALPVSLACFSSYPFLFSLERGNSDLLCSALMMGVGWRILRREQSSEEGLRWDFLSILLLTIATQPKVYPAIISALWLVPQLGSRSARLLHFGAWSVLNFLLLFVLGFDTLQAAWTHLTHASIETLYVWPGNHSIRSFFETLQIGEWTRATQILVLAFAALSSFFQLRAANWFPLVGVFDPRGLSDPEHQSRLQTHPSRSSLGSDYWRSPGNP